MTNDSRLSTHDYGTLMTSAARRSRNVPKLGIASAGREGWACSTVGRAWGRLGSRRLGLGIRCCGYQRTEASQPQQTKRSHRDEPPARGCGRAI